MKVVVKVWIFFFILCDSPKFSDQFLCLQRIKSIVITNCNCRQSSIPFAIIPLKRNYCWIGDVSLILKRWNAVSSVASEILGKTCCNYLNLTLRSEFSSEAFKSSKTFYSQSFRNLKTSLFSKLFQFSKARKKFLTFSYAETKRASQKVLSIKCSLESNEWLIPWKQIFEEPPLKKEAKYWNSFLIFSETLILSSWSFVRLWKNFFLLERTCWLMDMIRFNWSFYFQIDIIE